MKAQQLMSSTIIFVAESFVYISICGYFAFISSNWIPIEYLNIALSAFAIIAVYFMPESPRFLIAQGRHQKARSVLDYIAKFNGVKAGIAYDFEFVN